MYKVKQEGSKFLIYESIQSSIGEITNNVCAFFIHNYDIKRVEKQATQYCEYLNKQDNIVLDVLK